ASGVKFLRGVDGFLIDAGESVRLLAAVKAQLENVFASWAVSPAVMDQLWAGAWWYLGTTFFRQAAIPWRGRMEPLLHLRVRLDRFRLSTSQRRILRRNADLRIVRREAKVDALRRDLFDRHKQRFQDGVPQALDDFVGPLPSQVPVSATEFDVFQGRRLIAVSYLARGHRSVASLYGFFDPRFSSRSLGLLTMLEEIAFARSEGCDWYYPGYALQEPSSMDYKKRFHGLEAYDWDRGWLEFPRETRESGSESVLDDESEL
ncbi:MAG: GNAT family N-acetyltransferase, partial [Verrucomicrobiae bacterium]|nr:GNAT family N-acetyltransferase [Verrucomicrobiae bacterium]